MIISLGYKTNDDVEHGRNARDDNRKRSGDFKNKLESTCQEKTRRKKKNTTSEINWRSRRVETIELFVTTKQMSPLDEHQKRMASGIYLLS